MRFTQIYADKRKDADRRRLLLCWIRELVVVFRLDICPYPVLLIRVNLCNLWMIILKDWITGQARDDTVL